MRSYGIDGIKSHIRQGIQLGVLFHSLVLSRKDLFHVVTEPAFALVLFSVVPRLSASDPSSSSVFPNADAITKEVVDTLNNRGQIFLLGVDVNGKYAIRVCCAIPKAEEHYIRHAFDIIVRTTNEALDRYRDTEQQQGSEEIKLSHKPGKVIKRSKKKQNRRSPKYHPNALSKYTQHPMPKGVATV